jgi:hypothetical protein
MALVHQNINLKDILSEIATTASKIRRTTNTLIEYYIYPEKTPSAISAYEPRLGILESRTKSLAKISFPHLSQILEHAEATGASYATDIIEQLLNAVHGLDQIFKNRYDRSLEERKPYLTVYTLLDYREKQLQNFVRMAMTNPNQIRPENMLQSDSMSFCRGAIQMINNRDNGHIRPVKDRELSEANLSVIRQFGGGYLWWECAACKFQVAFHMVNSNNSNIHTVEEVREHPNMELEYRSEFLAKCHLYAPTADEDRYLRRRSSFSPSFAFNDTAKYGCVFCFAEGKSLEKYQTAFDDARDLATHLLQKHKSPLPPSLMLLKFCVAVKGKCAERVNRWDVNFR